MVIISPMIIGAYTADRPHYLLLCEGLSLPSVTADAADAPLAVEKAPTTPPAHSQQPSAGGVRLEMEFSLQPNFLAALAQ